MKTIISNATIVNNGESRVGSLLINDGKIEKVVFGPSEVLSAEGAEVIDARGQYLLPGVIDDHVHFREPGMTAKADMHTESMAAAAGGVTSVLDMPNVVPQTTTVENWRQRMELAKDGMHVNYAFFIGATNNNLDEIMAMPLKEYPGVKLFMGSSTGNMLVDKREMLEQLFSRSPKLIMTHCEETSRINANMKAAQEKYGDDPPIEQHPVIRDAEACWQSSALAAELAHATSARLHIAHISTEKELSLLGGNITGEACVAHLLYTDADYARLRGRIKCNPAIKTAADRQALRRAIADGTITCIGTDHAPHLPSEKDANYTKAPSGLPSIQQTLPVLLTIAAEDEIPLTRIASVFSEKASDLYRLDRGRIAKGQKADLVVFDYEKEFIVKAEDQKSKCGWTPYEGVTLKGVIEEVYINGQKKQ